MTWYAIAIISHASTVHRTRRAFPLALYQSMRRRHRRWPKLPTLTDTATAMAAFASYLQERRRWEGMEYKESREERRRGEGQEERRGPQSAMAAFLPDGWCRLKRQKTPFSSPLLSPPPATHCLIFERGKRRRGKGNLCHAIERGCVVSVIRPTGVAALICID